ncbi:MAG: transposase, partial [Acidobacteria bacterium]|nr:transposase [Acidobacteriota bacterium]
MQSTYLRALALRVVYHLRQKLPDLHGQPTRTLVMMVSALIAAGGPWLSRMGRKLADLPGALQDKVKRMSRFLCQSEFDLGEAFETLARRVIETAAHANPKRMILVALDWTDLGDFMGLWLSLPYHGRAIPLSGTVLEKEKALGSMTGEEELLLKRFLGLFPPELRDRIVILADRGFAKTELLTLIRDLGAHFAIRLPRNHHVLAGGSWMALAELPMEPGGTRILRDGDYTQEASFRCHLAVRRLRVGEAEDPQDDRWYIATDAQDPADAPGWYARRFQIEEMFRDLKGRLNMARHQLQREESVGKMMLIVTLAYRVILEEGTQWRERVDVAKIQKKTARGKLSVWAIAHACFEWCL